MGIIQLPTQLVGTSGIRPNFKFMATTDTLSTITAAGYLNSVDLQSNPIGNSDILQVLYSYVLNTNVGTYGIFTVSIVNGVITLTQWSNPGDVLLPVVSGDIAIFNGTSGQIKDSGLLPSSTSSQLYVATTPGTLTIGQIPKFNDANGTLANGGILASNVMSLAAINTMASGSEIILDKGTAITTAGAATLNKQSGVLTTPTLSTAGGASYVITLTNSEIALTSVVMLSYMGGTNTTTNLSMSVVPGTGTATITIYNDTAATEFNGTVILGFLVV